MTKACNQKVVGRATGGPGLARRACALLLAMALALSTVPAEALAEAAADASEASAQATQPTQAQPTSAGGGAPGGDADVAISAPAEDDEAALEAAVQALEDAYWRPSPTYGTDTNVNDMVLAKLAALGADVEGLDVRVLSAQFSSTDPAATVGIGTGESDNGQITYFFADPDDLGHSWGVTTMRQVQITFLLSRGSATLEWTPSGRTMIPWDEAKVTELLERRAQDLGPTYSVGDSASSVTGDLSLPNKVGGASWTSVEWSSSSDAIRIEGDAWDDAMTGAVSRTSSDQTVTLTARVSMTSTWSDEEISVERSFEVFVAADPEAAERERLELQGKVDAAFSSEALRELGTGGAVSPDALTCDLQLPTARALGIDGADYEVAYTASDDALRPNGYAAYAYRPLPGEPARTVDLTLSVTSKANPEVNASKTVALVVSPLTDQEISDELTLMESARKGYAVALADGADPQALEGGLHPFQKAYLDDSGSLAWAYDSQAASAQPGGIVASELPGSGEASGYRLFRSSRPDVLAHESLALRAQPEYNTEVTVTSLLSSARYGRYADEYPDDLRFRALSDQEVSATFIVVGTTGQDDPAQGQPVLASVRVTGPDATGSLVSWAADVPVSMGQGSTVADATLEALSSSGLEYDYSAGYLASITSPFTGEALGLDAKTGAYWQLWVNGEYAMAGASQIALSQGDLVEWRYAADEAGGPSGEPDGPGQVEGDWSQVGPAASGNVTTAPTPTTAVEEDWSVALMDPGAFSPVSEPVVAGGKTLVAVGDHLLMLSSADGSVEARVALAGSIDYTCRPLLHRGVLYVPLSGGAVDALAMPDMTRLWTSAPTAAGDQSSCTLRVVELEGRALLVYGTASYGTGGYESGTAVALDAETGERVWANLVEGTGYYWTGAAQAGDFLVMGDAAGTLRVLDASTGEERGSLSLGAAVSADLVPYDGSVLVATRDGVLHEVRVDSDGTPVEVAAVAALGGCTAAPTVVGSRAVLCGTTPGGSSAAVAIVDLGGMRVERLVTSAQGATLPAGSASAPALVSIQAGGTYVYFTVNWAEGPDASWTHYAAGGNLYVYRMGDAEARLLYAPGPDNANYCDSQVLCDELGGLYYLNDSGVLVRLAAGSGGAAEGGDDEVGRDPVGDGARPMGGAGAAGAAPSVAPAIRDQLSGPTQGRAAAGRASGEEPGQASAAARSTGGSAVAHSAGESAVRHGTEEAGRTMPWWPFAGMVAALAALAWALLGGRRQDGREE